MYIGGFSFILWHLAPGSTPRVGATLTNCSNIDNCNFSNIDKCSFCNIDNCACSIFDNFNNIDNCNYSIIDNFNCNNISNLAPANEVYRGILFLPFLTKCCIYLSVNFFPSRISQELLDLSHVHVRNLHPGANLHTGCIFGHVNGVLRICNMAGANLHPGHCMKSPFYVRL